MNELYYQEMSVAKPPRPKTHRQALLTSPSPVVSLSGRVTLPFGKSPIGIRLEQELGILRHRIQTVMPIVGGVMLRIVLHEAKEPDEEGHLRQRFVDLEILRGGPVPSLVAFTALPQAKKIKRAPPGWVGKALYVWVTR